MFSKPGEVYGEEEEEGDELHVLPHVTSSSSTKLHQQEHDHYHQHQRQLSFDTATHHQNKLRLLFQRQVSHISKDAGGSETTSGQQIFAEMQELFAGRWVQTARWVKYEEVADVDGGRWSTPHVATFDGKAITCLQHLLTTDICLFDSNFQDLKTLATLIGDTAVDHGYLSREKGDKLAQTIVAKHLHFRETQRGVKEAFHRASHVSMHQIGVKTEPEKDADVLSQRTNNHFARKLEKSVEGAAILVGAVDYLEKPFFIFIRQGSENPKVATIEDLTEVKVPIRYVVALLGPLQRLKMMREVARVAANLLTDNVYQVVAHTANSCADLLVGLRNFSDHATILPPNQWNQEARLDPPAAVGTQEERRKILDYAAEFEIEEAESLLLDKPKIDPFAVHLPPGLQVTGRVFGGLAADVRRKVPFFLSDFKDGFSVQCIATVLFLFFIILTQMVSFGGLMGESTGNNIAAFETIVSASINGIIYNLFSGQPLNVISSTGPVLVFERLLYNLCQSWGLQFLEFRFWVGMWMALIMLIIVMFDLSFLVCFITRFTEDNFAALIATIFIYESFKSIYKIYKQSPVNFRPSTSYTCECRWRNETLLAWWQATQAGGRSKIPTDNLTNSNNGTSSIVNCGDLDRNACLDYEHCEGVGPDCGMNLPVPDVFFFSLLLFCGTFLLATWLKEFRSQPFFSHKTRVVISDFAVSITVFTMVTVDYVCGFSTAKLLVPKEFRPTNPNREWMAPIFRDNPWWSILVAFPPGLLASILLFMDHQITTVIVNRKEHLLKKGFGYHLDLFILCVQIVICSLFGITWLVAATVLAIGHVNSLRKESESAAPGEKPKFLGLLEQRVTGILIFSLIGLSIVLRDFLALIPMPVLYGCFLYMGCNVLRGCGIYQRTLLLLMPAKYQPNYLYLQHVRLPRVHLFTAIQLASFACLWGLKEVDAVSMLFPLMLVVMVFIRKSLDCVFTNEELHYLDDIMPPFKVPRAPKHGSLSRLTSHIPHHRNVMKKVETVNGMPVLYIP